MDENSKEIKKTSLASDNKKDGGPFLISHNLFTNTSQKDLIAILEVNDPIFILMKDELPLKLTRAELK